MNVIPRISHREKRFDTSTGQLLVNPLSSTQSSSATTTTSTINTTASSQQRRRREDEERATIVQVCEMLCVPLHHMGSLIRMAGEAKVICECSMVSRKIQNAWPLFLVAMSTLQFTSRRNITGGDSLSIGDSDLEACAEQFWNSSFTMMFMSNSYLAPLSPMLTTISQDQQLSIHRLLEKFKQWIQQLTVIRDKLTNFADLNASLVNEFTIQEVKHIAKQKRVLCDLEKAMVSRIDWILNGCPSDTLPDMRSWDELFGVERQNKQMFSMNDLSPSSQHLDDRNESSAGTQLSSLKRTRSTQGEDDDHPIDDDDENEHQHPLQNDSSELYHKRRKLN